MVKLAPEILSKYVLSKFVSNDPNVLIGAEVGEDAAVVKTSDDVVVIHPDPISGAVKFLGYLAIKIPANDVAVSGAYPKYFTTVLLLPEKTSVDELNVITSSMKEALEELKASLVGGHTEYTDSVSRPIAITTAFGFTKRGKVITSKGAKEDDVVIMTKSAGIEGTAVIASDFRELLKARGIDDETIEEGVKMIKHVSVVEEATILSDLGVVTSMHDPTEGGVLCGLAEVAYASKTSLIIHLDKIKIHPTTLKLSSVLGVNPLKMLSSGALIATVPKSYVDLALDTLSRKGIDAYVIGEVVKGGSDRPLVTLMSGGKFKEALWEPHVEDEVIKLWERMTT
ncbi:MAG: hypothetical protein B7O98_03590 [Zestosphaera tikiterensis]|uniref:Hydrogenase assembly protein HupF n=1 Tax=Zestosphaera tikiterensis TaxID=1973259 RepID=A0A2R7Y9H3_9CREN|nr:MAG: hypothetical protein B7O98_03590 [Zestosphaera tikiterensis]